jgi:hypothetical protein
VSQGVVAAVQASRQINSEHLDCDEELLAQRKDPSFQKFICGLTSSSSDKSFHLKKQFSQILPPIVENIAENEDLPDEQVDYGSSGESGESSQATDMPFIPSGTGILALAVPAARQDHAAVVIPVGGSQPEVESTQEEEELASQENLPEASRTKQSTQNDGDDQRRRSTRVAGQGSTSTRIDDKAMAAAEKKNLSGTTLNSSNSFAALDDDDIIARALEMGISHDSFPSEKVNYLKDLEIARHSINEMHGKSEDIPIAQSAPQILLLGLSDNGDDDMEDYTPVVSRRSKKKKKSADRKSLRGTLAKSGVASGGA